MSSGNFKTTYKADNAIFQTTFVIVWMFILFVGILVFPFIAGSYFLYVMNLVCIAVIGCLGLNLLSGFAGQLSLGHGGFLAVGGYFTVILIAKAGLSIWVAIPIAGCFTAISSLVISGSSLRLRGLYFTISTLAFQFIIEHIILHWENLTGGPKGIPLPSDEIPKFLGGSLRNKYFFLMAFTIAAIIFAKNISRSKTGRAFVAIREMELAAKVLGLNIAKFKIIAFLLSSFFAGIAGSLYVLNKGFIGPEDYNLQVSIEYIMMVLIGGIGTILGSIFGAIFVVILPEALRLVFSNLGSTYPFLSRVISDIQNIILGLIIIVFLIFEPEGLEGIWRRIKRYWKNWPWTY